MFWSTHSEAAALIKLNFSVEEEQCKYSLAIWSLPFSKRTLGRGASQSVGVSELLLLPIHGSLSLSLSLSHIQRNNGDTNSRQIQMTILRCPLEESACECVLSSSHFVCLFVCR
jgi:hypothetical protein